MSIALLRVYFEFSPIKIDCHAEKNADLLQKLQKTYEIRRRSSHQTQLMQKRQSKKHFKVEILPKVKKRGVLARPI